MKGTTINPENYKIYGFENKPKYLTKKVYDNGYINYTGVYFTSLGRRYTVTYTHQPINI